MLYKFFANLFSIYSSMNFFQKVKEDENGICYITGLRRYVSILLDTIIILIFLLFYMKVENYFIAPESETLQKAQIKYSTQIELSAEEEIARSAYLTRFIILGIFRELISFILIMWYIIYMWVRFAATPGKLLFGLRIVDARTFENITTKQAIKRFFMCILSATPLLLGFICASFSKRCQTWHDKIAHTVVVTNRSLQKFKQKPSLDSIDDS